jgi:hypothetical protein
VDEKCRNRRIFGDLTVDQPRARSVSLARGGKDIRGVRIAFYGAAARLRFHTAKTRFGTRNRNAAIARHQCETSDSLGS